MLDRRTFIIAGGAAALARGATANPTTVLYGERSTTVEKIQPDPKNLWVRKADLPKINDFEVKPQGACRNDLCIPISKDLTHGEFFNLTGFAQQARTGRGCRSGYSRVELRRDSGFARRLCQLADRSRFRGAGSQGQDRPPDRFPRQEGAGGHLGLLVRMPPRSARLAESLRGAEGPEFRNRRRRAGYGRRKSGRRVVRQSQGDVTPR